MAVGVAEEEVVGRGLGRALGLELPGVAEHRVVAAAREVALDRRHRPERIVLPGEDEGPVRVEPARLPEAGEEHLQLRPAAPFELDFVLEAARAELLEAGLVESREAGVVADQDLRRRALAQGADETQHLIRIPVRQDEICDPHAWKMMHDRSAAG